MSNETAIFAVTATLKDLLEDELEDVLNGPKVHTRPPDKVRQGASGLANELNLFLYAVSPNAAFRNDDMFGRVRPGETGVPPLALDLHYLLTAYGEGDDENVALSHLLLGHALRILHDHGLLPPEEIRRRFPPGHGDTDLDRQIELVRVTPETLTIEELSKLWTIFQTPYRPSAAFQASVVLIDSGKKPRMPLPVLKRGEHDRGWPGTTVPPPTLSEVKLPAGRAGAQLRDTVTSSGSSLQGTERFAIFTHARFGPGPRLPIAAGANAEGLPIVLEADEDWKAGLYTVAVKLTRNGESYTSNAVPMVLLPRATVTPLRARPGTVGLTIDVTPAVLKAQQVSLLFGDRELPIPLTEESTSQLHVTISDVTEGRYVVRLRVDGVDSSPFELAGKPPVLEFSSNQIVVVER